MVFQKRWYTLKLDLSFCYIFYVLKIISFRLKEEKRSLVGRELTADFCFFSPRPPVLARIGLYSTPFLKSEYLV